MKLLCGRTTDIRDVFMLAVEIKNPEWIVKEVGSRYNYADRYKKLITNVKDPDFKNNLQGVYGIVPQPVFERHLKALERLHQK